MKIVVTAHTDKVIARKVLTDIEEAKKLVIEWRNKYGCAVSMDVDSD